MTSENNQAVLYRKPRKDLDENPEDYDEEERLIPPDGGWGWIIVIAGFFAHVLSDGVMYAFGVIIDELIKVYPDTPVWEITVVGSLLPAVILGVGPVASTLITLFGARAITIAGAIIACLSLVVSAFAPSLTFLSISVGVFCGFGFGIVYLPAIVMVSYYFEKRRSIAMGLTVVGSGIGTVIFPPFLRFLIDEYGWRGTFVVLGGVVLNCIACGLVLLPLKPTKVYVKKQVIEVKKNLSAVSEEKEGQQKRESGEKDVLAPLLSNGTADGEDAVAFRQAEEVKFRRGFSQSHMMSVTVPMSRPRNFSESDFGKQDGQQSRQAKLISLHQSQLLSSQRNNPDVILRPDLRYPSSLTNIPLYASNRELFVEQINKFISEPKLTAPEDAGEDTMDSVEKPNLWAQMVVSLRNSFDFSLFRDVPYFLFCFSSFVTSIGYNAPYLFIVAWGTDLGIPQTEAARLSSFIGIGNIVGRLFFGFLGDVKQIPRLMLYNVALTLCGVATMVSPFYGVYWWMVTVSFSFGFFIGAYIGLTPLLLVDLMGLHRLDVSFGILGLVQCIATLFGPPLLGYLRDVSGSFSLLFYGCGATIAFSGLMLFPLYFFFDKCRSTKVTVEEQELGRLPTMSSTAAINGKDTQQSSV